MRKTILFHDLNQTLDYVVLGFDVPARGEYYLSNNNIAYLASHTLTDGVKRMIVVPKYKRTKVSNLLEFVKSYGERKNAIQNMH